MDPNEALGSLRDCIEHERWEEAAGYAAALDEWLSKSGFLPYDWRRAG